MSFHYFISRMPYLNSNTPSQIFCASVGLEILGIARTTAYLTCVNLLLMKRKRKFLNNLVSFDYSRKSLENTLKYFIYFQILLMNSLSSNLYNYFTYLYAHVYFDVNINAYICILCVKYVCMYLCL